MLGIYRQLLSIACVLGKVEQAFMYKSGFISIEGTTHEGKGFALTLTLKEEEKKDGN